MNTKILTICNAFEEKQISIHEFQKRLETVLLVDKEACITDKDIKFGVDKLEEIIYCNLEKDYYQLGLNVCNYFREKINSI